MPRPRSYRIALTHRERETIRHFRRKKSTSYYAKIKCSVLLAADESNSKNVPTYQEIADKSGTSVPTVIDTLKKFSKIGFRGAIEPARNNNSNTSRLKATGDVEAKIIAQACKPAPKGHARWTVSLLTEECAVILEEPLSRATVGRVLKNNELRPHLSEYWCIPPDEDADFVANMEDILDV